MSYTKSFAALAGAAALSAQMATAAPSNDVIEVQQGFGSMMVQQQQTIIPPEMRPLIGDLDVNVNVNVDFEGGVIKTDSLDIDITNVACDNIEPLFEMLDAQDLAENEYYGFERSAEEQAFVDSIRKLFIERVLDYNETVTPQMLVEQMEAAGMVGVQLPSDFPEASSVSIHIECDDYVAPEPTFTPVEPN